MAGHFLSEKSYLAIRIELLKLMLKNVDDKVRYNRYERGISNLAFDIFQILEELEKETSESKEETIEEVF